MQVVKRIFTLFLLACVLFSTHAFTVYEHTCLFTGQVKTSLSADTRFCGVQPVSQKPFKSTTFSKSSCCKISFKEFKNNTIHNDFSKIHIEKAFVLQSPIFQFTPILFVSGDKIQSFLTSISYFSSKIYLQNNQFII